MAKQLFEADVGAGTSYPLGSSAGAGGVNFSVFSRSATLVELLLFDKEEDTEPSRVVALDAGRHRTYHYWHALLPGLSQGQLYGYRVHGPFDPARGQRFDSTKVLLDPYSRTIAVPDGYSRAMARRTGTSCGVAMKSIVANPHQYDWQGDCPLKRPFSETVIYELHVAGFTRHHSSGVAPSRAGTYAGLIEKIPYLQDLGITAVELLPIFQFDAQDAPAGLSNYWGYSPVSFFAPHRAYSSRKDPCGPIDEFRDMVKALHRAGIEVLLDVVYNHTAEGGQDGPTFGFRGLENSVYYILEQDRSRYANYSGTGNTLNANHAVVRRFVQDSLRYWVTEMHVDGFRFDLASILSRDESGCPEANPPVLWDIESDPVLAGTKLIAEAWDAAGLYQVGSFVGDSWHEWNGRFRDDVRRFVRSDNDTVRTLPARLLGSPDLYAHKERAPDQSVNFITSHDGFTLNDLVSYNGKHNEDNREGGRDGSDTNWSWNCGTEGPTADPGIERLRTRQIKNFLAILILSLGTPMLCMGDEFRRTQRGNNNPWCQDNEISWVDWQLLKEHEEIHRFVKLLLRSRKARPIPGELSLNELLRASRTQWCGVTLDHPDWSEASHALALSVGGASGHPRLHAMFNGYWDKLAFELPGTGGSGGRWRRLVDTSLAAPDDIVLLEAAAEVAGSKYTVQQRSIVVLETLEE